MLKSRMLKVCALLCGSTLAALAIPGCDQLTSVFSGLLGGLIGT